MIRGKADKAPQLSDRWIDESEWAVELMSSIEKFIETYGQQPTHVVLHPRRLNRMSMQVSTSVAHEMGRFEFQHLGVFACELGEVQIVSDEEMPEDEYLLKAEKSGNDYGKPQNESFFVKSAAGGVAVAQPAVKQAPAAVPTESTPVSTKGKNPVLRSKLRVVQGGKK